MIQIMIGTIIELYDILLPSQKLRLSERILLGSSSMAILVACFYVHILDTCTYGKPQKINILCKKYTFEPSGSFSDMCMNVRLGIDCLGSQYVSIRTDGYQQNVFRDAGEDQDDLLCLNHGRLVTWQLTWKPRIWCQNGGKRPQKWPSRTKARDYVQCPGCKSFGSHRSLGEHRDKKPKQHSQYMRICRRPIQAKETNQKR